MKRCQRCDLNFPDNLSFCESCGGTLGESTSTRCPVCGEAVQPGWKFCVQCRTPLPASATADLYKTNAKPTPQPTERLNTPEERAGATPLGHQTVPSVQQDIGGKVQVRIRCRACRNLVDEKAEFCDSCGASMFETHAPLPPPVEQVRPSTTPPRVQPTTEQSTGAPEWYAAPDPYHETYKPTPPPGSETPRPRPPRSIPSSNDEKGPPRLSMMESYGKTSETPRGSFRWWHGVLALFAFLVVGGLAGGAIYWWMSSRDAVTNAQPNQNQSTSSTSPGSVSPGNQKSANPSADNELNQLSERRVAAQEADKAALISAYREAETKYPADYRFPYERARLISKDFISHEDAFNSLFHAAEKAIDAGKAQEMLDVMNAEKDGDFRKLSKGHPQWKLLDNALVNNDKSALKANH